MLSKLQNMGQSLRDVTKAIADSTKAKITELQALPDEIPESWDECIDDNGKPYYIDTETGEWYRLKQKQHKRIDTNEKIHILTAESKKEFDEQKQKMETEDSDMGSLPSDTDSDELNHSDDDSKLNSDTQVVTANGHTDTDTGTDTQPETRKRKKSNHSKRSSTSVSKGWQCEKCTLENVGHAETCNACLAPRPERADDEDEDELAISSGIHVEAMKDHLAVEENDRSHQQMSTLDAINSAVDASLEEMGGQEVKTLSAEEKRLLIGFMDVVESEPDPSIKYLREANWDLQVAMDTYFRQHPDHPKSRGGSLQFDLQQMKDIYPSEFDADIELPPDIIEKQNGAGRRKSTELDEIPNGARESDEDIDVEQDSNNENDNHNNNNNNNNNHNIAPDIDSDSDSNSDKQISYVGSNGVDDHDNNESYALNGVRDEYSVGVDDDDQQYASHRRLNTDQQITLATQMSLQQTEYDGKLDEYRNKIEELSTELKEERSENDRLQRENEELQMEKERYAQQSRQIQNDWDRMSSYMTDILSEVAFIEEQRKKGEDISTPTPKLNNIFQQIQSTISTNRNIEDMIDEDEEDDMMQMMENTQQIHDDDEEQDDIYENVADLFSEEAPITVTNDKAPIEFNEAGPSSDAMKRKRKLSFGAVNELFANSAPVFADNENEDNNNENVSNNNFLSVNKGHGHGEDDDEKGRLSYGGVGLLFDAFDSRADVEDIENELNHNENENGNNDDENKANNIDFTSQPTYEGIASLFDESNDILGHNKGKASFAGDIVELFQSPDDNDNGNEIETQEQQQDDDESSEDMDQQHFYTYSDDDDDADGGDGDEDDDEDDEEEDNKAEAEDKVDDLKEDKSKKKDNIHQRYESYNSNMSDPTPLSRRGSRHSSRKHSRGPSFAFKDLFRGDESDSSDRAPSVQSAPEEHDYYAITAYYGIEDDDAAGWDSRRSSMFGDYGRVHSRRESKRVQSQMVDADIREMFKVDLTKKLTKHLSADVEDNETKDITINIGAAADHDDDDEDNDLDLDKTTAAHAHVVADLFESDSKQTQKHSKKDTYTGVRNLFGNDADEDDEDGDMDDDGSDIGDLETERLNAKQRNKVPRPSTNMALGSTFDSISLKLKDRTQKAPPKDRTQQKKAHVKEESENTEQINIEEIREEERAKLTVIEQQLRENLESEREDLRRIIEGETNERLTQELTLKLKNELTQTLTLDLTANLTQSLSETLRPTIQSELREEIEREWNQKLENEHVLNDELNSKFTQLNSRFDSKMHEFETRMNEREEGFAKELSIVRKSKCDLIQETAKEIDSLRQIIIKLNEFSTKNQNNSINVNAMFNQLLKWG